MQILASVLGLVLLGAAGLGALFVGGMRTKWPPVIDRVRRMNRAFFSEQQLEMAGEPGAYAGVVHHVGRKSGTAYATPVTIERLDDDFIIALVYGRRTDWARNVLAAGTATIDLDGDSYEVDRPEIIPTSQAAEAFSSSDRMFQRVLATDECLRLQPAAAITE